MSTPAAAPALELHLSVAAHTNQGKTTLVRSLVEEDVGDVLDRAHVTEQASAHPWIEAPATREAPAARVVLWDTPGFGDSARLLARLKGRANPFGWLVAQVWDRVADRALWSSQRALEHVRERSDVVLYQVSAAEPPEEAGYLEPELEILAWLEKPVLLVLNVLGPPGPPDPAATLSRRREQDLARWRAFAARHPLVRGVLPLDAFSCSPRDELALLEALRPVLAGEKLLVLERALAVLRAKAAGRIARSAERIAAALAASAADREPLALDGRRERERASGRLRERLRERTKVLADELIGLFALEGRSQAEVRAQVEDLVVRGRTLDESRAGWIGAVLGGLGTGLLADLLAGGLTLGTGAIAGAAGGWLAGRGLARGQRLLQRGEQPSVAWTDELLERVALEWLLLELAVARHRRGRGPYRDPAPGEGAQAWRRALEARLAPRRESLRAALARARAVPRDQQRPHEAERELTRLLAGLLEELAA